MSENVNLEARVVAEKEIRKSYKGVLRVSPNNDVQDGELGGELTIVTDSAGNPTTLEVSTIGSRSGNTTLVGTTLVGESKSDRLVVDAKSTVNGDLSVLSDTTYINSDVTISRDGSLRFGTSLVPLAAPAAGEVLIGDGSGNYVLKNISGGGGGGGSTGGARNYFPVTVVKQGVAANAQGKLFDVMVFDLDPREGQLVSMSVAGVDGDHNISKTPFAVSATLPAEMRTPNTLVSSPDKVREVAKYCTTATTFGGKTVCRGYFITPHHKSAVVYCLEGADNEGDNRHSQDFQVKAKSSTGGDVVVDDINALYTITATAETPKLVSGHYSVRYRWTMSDSVVEYVDYNGVTKRYVAPSQEEETVAHVSVNGTEVDGGNVTFCNTFVAENVPDGATVRFELTSVTRSGQVVKSNTVTIATPELYPFAVIENVDVTNNTTATSDVTIQWSTAGSSVPVREQHLTLTPLDGGEPREFNVTNMSVYRVHGLPEGRYSVTLRVVGENDREYVAAARTLAVVDAVPEAFVLNTVKEVVDKEGHYNVQVSFDVDTKGVRTAGTTMTVTPVGGGSATTVDVTGLHQFTLKNLEGNAEYDIVLSVQGTNGVTYKSSPYRLVLPALNPVVRLRSGVVTDDQGYSFIAYDWDESDSPVNVETRTLTVWDKNRVLFSDNVSGNSYQFRVPSVVPGQNNFYWATVDVVSVQGVTAVSNTVRDNPDGKEPCLYIGVSSQAKGPFEGGTYVGDVRWTTQPEDTTFRYLYLTVTDITPGQTAREVLNIDLTGSQYAEALANRHYVMEDAESGHLYEVQMRGFGTKCQEETLSNTSYINVVDLDFTVTLTPVVTTAPALVGGRYTTHSVEWLWTTTPRVSSAEANAYIRDHVRSDLSVVNQNGLVVAGGTQMPPSGSLVQLDALCDWNYSATVRSYNEWGHSASDSKNINIPCQPEVFTFALSHFRDKVSPAADWDFNRADPAQGNDFGDQGSLNNPYKLQIELDLSSVTKMVDHYEITLRKGGTTVLSHVENQMPDARRGRAVWTSPFAAELGGSYEAELIVVWATPPGEGTVPNTSTATDTDQVPTYYPFFVSTFNLDEVDESSGQAKFSWDTTDVTGEALESEFELKKKTDGSLVTVSGPYTGLPRKGTITVPVQQGSEYVAVLTCRTQGNNPAETAILVDKRVNVPEAKLLLGDNGAGAFFSDTYSLEFGTSFKEPDGFVDLESVNFDPHFEGEKEIEEGIQHITLVSDSDITVQGGVYDHDELCYAAEVFVTHNNKVVYEDKNLRVPTVLDHGNFNEYFGPIVVGTTKESETSSLYPAKAGDTFYAELTMFGVNGQIVTRDDTLVVEDSTESCYPTGDVDITSEETEEGYPSLKIEAVVRGYCTPTETASIELYDKETKTLVTAPWTYVGSFDTEPFPKRGEADAHQTKNTDITLSRRVIDGKEYLVLLDQTGENQNRTITGTSTMCDAGYPKGAIEVVVESTKHKEGEWRLENEDGSPILFTVVHDHSPYVQGSIYDYYTLCDEALARVVKDGENVWEKQITNLPTVIYGGSTVWKEYAPELLSLYENGEEVDSELQLTSKVFSAGGHPRVTTEKGQDLFKKQYVSCYPTGSVNVNSRQGGDSSKYAELEVVLRVTNEEGVATASSTIAVYDAETEQIVYKEPLAGEYVATFPNGAVYPLVQGGGAAVYSVYVKGENIVSGKRYVAQLHLKGDNENEAIYYDDGTAEGEPQGVIDVTLNADQQLHGEWRLTNEDENNYISEETVLNCVVSGSVYDYYALCEQSDATNWVLYGKKKDGEEEQKVELARGTAKPGDPNHFDVPLTLGGGSTAFSKEVEDHSFYSTYEAVLTLKGKNSSVVFTTSDAEKSDVEGDTLYPTGEITLTPADDQAAISAIFSVTADEVRARYAHLALYDFDEHSTVYWEMGDAAIKANWYENSWPNGAVFPQVGGGSADYSVYITNSETGDLTIVDNHQYVAHLWLESEKSKNQTIVQRVVKTAFAPEGAVVIKKEESSRQDGEWTIPAEDQVDHITFVHEYSVYAEASIYDYYALVKEGELLVKKGEEKVAEAHAHTNFDVPDALDHGANSTVATLYVEGDIESALYTAELSLTGMGGKNKEFTDTLSLYAEGTSLYPTGNVELEFVDNSEYTTLTIKANVTAQEVRSEMANLALYRVRDGQVSPASVLKAWPSPRTAVADPATWFVGAWRTTSENETSQNPAFPDVGGADADFTVKNLRSTQFGLADGDEVVVQLSLKAPVDKGGNETTITRKAQFAPYPEGELQFVKKEEVVRDGSWTVPAESTVTHIGYVSHVTLYTEATVHDYYALVTEDEQTNLRVRKEGETTDTAYIDADKSKPEHFDVPQTLGGGDTDFTLYVTGE